MSTDPAKTKTVRIEVVVPVDVTVPADDVLPEGTAPVTAALVATALHQLATDWNDGRYAFSAEMLHEGAGRLAQNAAHRALMLALDARFGNELVPDPKWGGWSQRATVAQRDIEEAVPEAGSARVVTDGSTARVAVPCSLCDGKGEVRLPDPHPDYPYDTRTCDACNATGCYLGATPLHEALKQPRYL